MSKRLRNLVKVTVLTMSIVFSTSVAAFAQSSTPTEFQNEVVQHMKNRETSFSITYTGDANAFVSQVSTLVNNSTKSDEYLDLSWTTKNASTNGTNGNLTVTFNVGYVATLAQEAVVDQKVPQIVAQVVTPGMTDFQKAKALHDYVCSITAYDYSLVKNSAYNALVDGKTVCRGYSLLLYRLYKEAGIPSHLVVGTLKGGSHAWNLVQLGGNWYHVDATNDDVNNFTTYYGMSDATARTNGFAWTQGSLPTAPSNLIIDDLTRATNAVKSAETYKKQLYVNIATSSVNTLADGTDKTALLQRLQVVQAYIIDTCTKAVVNAETLKTQASINTALGLVNDLSSGDIKTSLLNRLQVVQQRLYLANATTAVVNAEKYVTQTYIDTANKAIALLNDSSDKTALVTRLQAVSDKILLNATNAVTKAETSLLSTDVNSATTLVNAMTNGDSKTTLINKLNAVKLTIQINNATTSVTNAEKALTKASEQSAETLVKALPDGDTKTALVNRLSAIKVTIVTNAVVVAETTPTQANVTLANSLLPLLPDGDTKTGLSTRIQVVQQTVYLNNATINVVNAEKALTQTSVDLANKTIAVLNDGDSKTALINRIQVVSKTMVDNATNAVVKAETSLLTTDVTIANKLVAVLPTGDVKTSLVTRLNTIKSTIQVNNSTNAVVKTETSKLMADVNTATLLVNALPNGDTKTALSSRIATVKVTIATDAVVKAETSLSLTGVNSATTFTNYLPTGDVKTGLLNRISAVKVTMATDAVSTVETSLSTTDLNNAVTLVNYLPTGDIKTGLLNRIATVRVNMATKAVEKAETSLSLSDLSTASTLVIVLPANDTKTALLNRIATIKVTMATNAVTTAEKSITQTDINTASTLINVLPTGDVKTALTNRLNAVKLALPIANATRAVESAESSKTQTNVNTALSLVNGLPTSNSKTALLNRVQTVQQSIYLASATIAVQNAEKYKTSTYITTAKTLIAKLADGADKTNLTNRVNAIIL